MESNLPANSRGMLLRESGVARSDEMLHSRYGTDSTRAMFLTGLDGRRPKVSERAGGPPISPRRT